MKNLIKELKSYFAEKLIFWALCLNPETVIDLTVPSGSIAKKIPVLKPKTEIERVIDFIKIQMFINGWGIIKENKQSNLIQIQKEMDGKSVKMSIYYKSNSKRNDLNLTISTAMEHPKKGKTQLHRKNVGKETFFALLADPRSHTGAGYYKKPKTKKK